MGSKIPLDKNIGDSSRGPANPYPIRGRLLESASILNNFDLRAYSDATLETEVARAKPDKSGAFSFELPVGLGEIWVAAKSGNRVAARTPWLQPYLPRSGAMLELFLVSLPEEARASSTGPVTATIRFVDGKSPAAGQFRVALLERNARRCVLHDFVTVPATGKVAFTPDPAKQLSTRNPDLFVRVYLADGTPLIEEPSFDVCIPLRFATANTELSHVDDVARSSGVLVRDLDDDDIAYLTRREGVPEDRLRALSEADKLAQKTGTSREVAYGWLRAVSAGVRPENIGGALAFAREHNLSPAPDRDHRDALAKIITNETARAALARTGRFGGASLDEILRRRIPDADTRGRFAVSYLASAHDDEFWNQWQKELGVVDALRFTTEVARIVDQLDLIRTLDEQFDRGSLASVSDLATWSALQWQEFLTRATVPAPRAFQRLAENANEAVEFYAARIAASFNNSDPTASLRAMIEADPTAVPAWVQPVATFLAEHPDYQLEAGPWTWKQPTDFNSGTGKASLEGLAAIHTLLRLGASPRLIPRLLTAGYSSARAIARRAPATLINDFRAVEPVTSLLTIHDRAVAVSAKAVLLRTNMGRGEYAGLRAIAAPMSRTQRSDLLITWDTLFGHADRALCACRECRSAYSPASYLVTLLELLDAHPKGPSCPSAADADAAASGGSSNILSLAEVFVRRRPDVQELPLTCENTNVEVPQIDLVNERLEELCQPLTAHVPHTPGRGMQTAGTSAERNAEPQSPPNPNVTSRLQQAKQPWSLPYSYARDRALTGMKQLGLELPALDDLTNEVLSSAEGKSPCVDQPSGADERRAKDILGVTDEVWQILVTNANTPTLAAPFWPVNVHPPHARASYVMDATSLSYKDLLLALATRFVRGSADCGTHPTQIKLGGEPPDTCAVEKIRVNGLTWDILDRLHRFVRLARLTGMSLEQLDDALLAIGAVPPRGPLLGRAQLIAVAHIVGVQRLTERPYEAILPLFGDLGDDVPCHFDALEERKRGPFEKAFGVPAAKVIAAITAINAQDPTLTAEAAQRALAALAGMSRDDLDLLDANVLGVGSIETQMQGASATALICAARRVGLLAALADVGVSDVRALQQLSKLNVIPAHSSGPMLPALVWRFLRFAKLSQTWALSPHEVAKLCLGTKPDTGVSHDTERLAGLLVLRRRLDAVDATMPDEDRVSVETLRALIAKVATASQSASGGGSGLVAAIVDDLDASGFQRIDATLLASLTTDRWLVGDPGVPDAFASLPTEAAGMLAFGGRPKPMLASDLTAVIANALTGYLAVPFNMTAAILPVVEDFFPWARALGTQPDSIEADRRRKLGEEIAKQVASKLVDRACAQLGADRADPTYILPTKSELAKLIGAAVVSATDVVDKLEAALGAVDLALIVVPQRTPREAAEAVVTGFERELSGCLSRVEAAVCDAIAVRAQHSRKFYFTQLRTGLLRDAREAATVRWLAEHVRVDQEKTSTLVRRLLRAASVPPTPLLSLLTPEQVSGALVAATYTNGDPTSAAVEIHSTEASLDLDWAGAAPAPGISPNRFTASLVLKGVSLAVGDTLAVRSPNTVTCKAEPVSSTAAIVTVATADGWRDVLSITGAGTFDITLTVDAAISASASPPSVAIRRTTAASTVTALRSQAFQAIAPLIDRIERAAEVVRAFPFIAAEVWPTLEAAELATTATGDRRISLQTLPVATGGASWFGPYLRLEALRSLLDAIADLPDVWRDYLQARATGVAADPSLWRRAQGLSESEAAPRRRMLTLLGITGDARFDECLLQAIARVAEAADGAGVSPDAALTLGGNLADAARDAAVLQALRAQSSTDRALQLLGATHDPVRLRYRDALVAYLLENERKQKQPRFVDTIGLNQWLLTDTQVSCCLTTTRVQFGYAAVQAFVERVLDRSLEDLPTKGPYWQGSLETLAREWVWKKHYRLWEANLNLFLTPENWLDDETRGDETHAFRDLREQLRQVDLTTNAAEDALTRYLRELHAISHVEILAMVNAEPDCSPTPLGFRSPEMSGTHVIARTRSLPYRYFYRRRLPDPDGRWLPWEPLAGDVEGDTFDLVVHDRRLYFFWARLDGGPPENSTEAQTATPDGIPGKYAVKLHWMERLHGVWRGRSTSPVNAQFDLRNYDVGPNTQLIPPVDKPSNPPKATSSVKLLLRSERRDSSVVVTPLLVVKGVFDGGPSLTQTLNMQEIAVGRNSDGRLEVFGMAESVFGNGIGVVWHTRQKAANQADWEPWTGLHIGVGSSIRCASNEDGRLEVFIIGTDDAIWHSWQTASGGWASWSSLGGSVRKFCVEANKDGSLELFTLDRGGGVSHCWQTSPNGGWSNWENLSKDSYTCISARLKQSSIELFVGPSKKYPLWRVWKWSRPMGWQAILVTGGDWENIHELDACINGDDRLELFGLSKTTGNTLQVYEKAASWMNPTFQELWGKLGTFRAVENTGERRLEVFGIGDKIPGDVHHAWQKNPGTSWAVNSAGSGHWSPLGAPPSGKAKALDVGMNEDGRLEVFAVDAGGALWSRRQKEADKSDAMTEWAAVTPSTLIVGEPADIPFENYLLPGEPNKPVSIEITPPGETLLVAPPSAAFVDYCNPGAFTGYLPSDTIGFLGFSPQPNQPHFDLPIHGTLETAVPVPPNPYRVVMETTWPAAVATSDDPRFFDEVRPYAQREPSRTFFCHLVPTSGAPDNWRVNLAADDVELRLHALGNGGFKANVLYSTESLVRALASTTSDFQPGPVDAALLGIGTSSTVGLVRTLDRRPAATRIASLARRAAPFLTTPSSTGRDLLIHGVSALVAAASTEKRWEMQPFYQPYTGALFGALARGATPGLLAIDNQRQSTDLLPLYNPVPTVVARQSAFALADAVDFSDTGPLADYNWELFYHAPMLVAQRLKILGRFEDARRWFNLILDPAAAMNTPTEAWQCKPLREASVMNAEDILRRLGDPNLADDALLRQLQRLTNEPFRPHLIARARPVAYAKATLLAYIELFIAWGDSLFILDDRTSIEEAQRKYEIAERLLGRVPEVVPERVVVKPTSYVELRDEDRTGDTVLDPLVDIEGIVQPEAIEATGGVAGGVPSLTPYFCYPGNERFDELRTKIADRQLKIRSCQNIEGIERVLSLYGNRIDPGVIARAVAAGVNPADVFTELNAPLPRFRFKELIQRAKEVCADAKSLGQSLIGSLEKKDAENQQLMRADLEVTALQGVRATKLKQKSEATKSEQAAEAAKAPAQTRKLHYDARIKEFTNTSEKSAQSLTEKAWLTRAAPQQDLRIMRSLSLLPDLSISVGTDTSVSIGPLFGGSMFAKLAQNMGDLWNFEADSLSQQASKAREQGGFEQRAEDWKLQLALASDDAALLEKQAAAAVLRREIAELDLADHDRQIEHAQANRELARTKFTNGELYGWMSSRLSALYYEQFRTAFDMALQAQRAWQYELGTDDRLLVGTPWDPGKKGLLASDELMARLHQLEVAFDERKPYDHAKRPDIWLSEIAPEALIQLRNTGRCEFSITNEYFDSIEPGGCFRRWKTVAVTLPCVHGPSAVFDGRLTLLEHQRQNDPTRSKAASVEVGGRDYIELSHGNRDIGLPETAGQEGWRLPFEGTGAISKWRLELPLETNTFARHSLTDVVLHTVYTARNGSPEARAKARDAAKDWPATVLIDIPSTFPEAWYTFQKSGVLTLQITPDVLPRMRGEERTWSGMTMYLEPAQPLRSVSVTIGTAAKKSWKLDRKLGVVVSDAGDLGPSDTPIKLKFPARDASGVSGAFVVLGA